MRIRLKTRLAGPEGNFPSGTELNLDFKEANTLIAGGYAVSLEPEEPKTKEKSKKKAVK